MSLIRAAVALAVAAGTTLAITLGIGQSGAAPEPERSMPALRTVQVSQTVPDKSFSPQSMIERCTRAMADWHHSPSGAAMPRGGMGADMTHGGGMGMMTGESRSMMPMMPMMGTMPGSGG